MEDPNEVLTFKISPGPTHQVSIDYSMDTFFNNLLEMIRTEGGKERYQKLIEKLRKKAEEENEHPNENPR